MAEMPATPPGVLPYLTVSDAKAAIAFYEAAFGAEVLFTQKHEILDKLIHATLAINGGQIYLSDDFPEMADGQSSTPESIGGTPVTLHIKVANVDDTVVKAVDNGATVLFPVTDMFWGDRFGTIRDPFGHQWSIATPVAQVAAEAAAEAEDAAPAP